MGRNGARRVLHDINLRTEIFPGKLASGLKDAQLSRLLFMVFIDKGWAIDPRKERLPEVIFSDARKNQETEALVQRIHEEIKTHLIDCRVMNEEVPPPLLYT